ncbi:MAG: flagellar hook-length control protein FliK [Phycisphaerae bacterium]
MQTRAKPGPAPQAHGLQPVGGAKRSPHRFGGAKETQSSQRAAFERIAKVIQAGPAGRETVARIALDPPALGHVQVHLRLRNDSVQVRLTADNPEARRVLLSQIDELRASLEQQGVKVQRLEIALTQRDGDTAPHDGSGDRADDAPSREGFDESGNHRHPAPAETGRGVSAAIDEPYGQVSGEAEFGMDDPLAEVRLDVRV